MMWKISMINRKTDQRIEHLMSAESEVEARRKAIIGKDLAQWKVLWVRQIDRVFG